MAEAFATLPEAWVVRCKKCSCTVNCRAIDPQTEHSNPELRDPAPRVHLVVSCACCWSPFRYAPTEIFKGHPARSPTCPVQKAANGTQARKDDKTNGAMLVAASLIAAVRLGRNEVKPSPVLHSTIVDSVHLAGLILKKLQE